MKYILVGIILGLFLVVLFSGCIDSGNSTTATANNKGINDKNEYQIQLDILSTATHASVSSFSKNWNETAEDDGIVIYPELKTDSDETVEFEDFNLLVDIEIWTTKTDYDTFKELKDRKIYSGSGTISSWKDGNPFYHGGIRIPFTDIKSTDSDDSYGLLLIKIHLPNGKIMAAKESMGVQIKP